MELIADVIVWIAYIISLYFTVFLFMVYMDKKKIFPEEENRCLALSKEPFVSILVPAYNEEKTITKTLESISNLDYRKDKIEVLVIDDGSKDKTQKVIENYIRDQPNFRLISHPNMGKAASMNKALKIARGEFFACLDADSFVDPLTLRKMLAFYYRENDPSLAIITPAMKVYQPKNLLQKVQWLEYNVMIFIARLSSHIDSIYVAPGPFSLYRTDVIRKLGGFDEKNITEDQEIAYRVQKNQYRIKQCVDGFVYTTAPAKIVPFYRQRRRWYLGSISCLYQYKEVIGNQKYGDFGMMQMIKNFLGYLLAIAGIILSIYIIFLPLLTRIKNLLLVKFDLWPYLTSLRFKFSFLNLFLTDFRKEFLIFFLMLLGAFFFYQAHKQANEKFLKFGWIPLIPYFAFYYILKSIILLLSLCEFARGRKIKW